MHETLANVGESKVIEAITRIAPSSLNGDDAAVLTPDAPNTKTVAATDQMVDGYHFNFDWSTPEEVGQKAILRNFADVESMGARPVASLLAIAAPPETPLSIIEGIARGVALRSEHYNAQLVGGDVTQSSQLVITVTALGTLGGDRPALTLGAARAGQRLVAHGKIGWAAAGLALLEKYGRNLEPEIAHLSPLIKAHCAPWLDPGRGMVARATGVKAMTDNSDGLVPDLSTMAKKSGVGIDLDSRAIAPDPLLVQAAGLLGVDPFEWVLTGGEDHTLVGTTSGDAPSGFRIIGKVTSSKESRAAAVTVDGAPARYNTGWGAY